MWKEGETALSAWLQEDLQPAPTQQGPGTAIGPGYTLVQMSSEAPARSLSLPCYVWNSGPEGAGRALQLRPELPHTRAASHPGGDVNRVHALGQGALQVLQRVQALYFAAAAIDELAEGVLLEQGLHVLEEEALAEQGQFWGIMDLWGQREEVRPTIPDRTYRARPSPRPGGGKGGPRVEWQSSPLFWKLSS